MKQGVCIGVASIGGLLVMLSLLWGFIFPPENSWTMEKSGRMSELSMEAHLLHMKVKSGEKNPQFAGDELSQAAARYREVTAELSELKAELESTKAAPKTAAASLRWVGLGLAIIGLVGLQIMKAE